MTDIESADDGSDQPPLIQAATRGQIDIVECLVPQLSSSDIAHGTVAVALKQALDNSHLAIVQMLLRYKMHGQTSPLPDGREPIHYAVETGDLDLARRLIDLGAKCDAENHENITPLWLAAEKGDVEIVRLLLQSGARLDIQPRVKHQPLFYAASGGHLEVVRLLLAGGAKADTPTINPPADWSPLLQVAFQGYTEIARLLIGSCPNLCLKPALMKPMHVAICRGHFDMFLLLISTAAGISPANQAKAMPRRRRVRLGNIEITKELANAEDGNGKTSLRLAVENGHIKIAEELIVRGAYFDRTFLDTVKGESKCMELLRRLLCARAKQQTP